MSRIREIYDFTNAAERDRIISGMRWLGLFSDELASVKSGNVFDTLCHHLGDLLAFAPGERDLVMLQHKFVVEWKDGKKVSRIIRKHVVVILISYHRTRSPVLSSYWEIQRSFRPWHCLLV